ncbi:hypothetical protein I6A60_07545 [Frankia sp. AgB1.9]|nr:MULTISPECIES: hypothetical protein [unclassified Frankia]MBL7490717.1 hypothetical protein [Frankia sp. AgW1.1]MBL7547727.1 hypothetical protein [Frankia sp. AgB1.9]MBL7622632.1 hypothetical protein [Frankia sp. AgB1.8]
MLSFHRTRIQSDPPGFVAESTATTWPTATAVALARSARIWAKYQATRATNRTATAAMAAKLIIIAWSSERTLLAAPW